MWEVSKSFRFEAAHTLSGTALGLAAEEVHGHSFRAEVAVEGMPDPATGLVVDLSRLEALLADVRRRLDHKMLNRIEGLGPPTLENLARYIFEQASRGAPVTRVTVYRDSCGEACTYRPRKN
ncbi:MAG TPA: 6-carboxytetrahydropterin synthase [Xanthobacteraceae bacterium]|nr:6-carboxytetrahydropterin synthase [Xanthobacteraceae bacterium]